MEKYAILTDEFKSGLKSFQIPKNVGILVHGSTASMGIDPRDAKSVLDNLLDLTGMLMMPTFSRNTLIIPEEGPEDNAIIYGSGRESNLQAIIYNSSTPVDHFVGDLAEKFRQMPGIVRSNHPVYSFSGINMKDIILCQTIKRPYDSIARLAQLSGWVILLGVDHTQNFSIHYAETLVGRKQFKRWALTENGIVECLRFPGCNKGFGAVEKGLEKITLQFEFNNHLIRAFPLSDMIAETSIMISKDPLALLCNDDGCLCCDEIRKSVFQ